MSFKLTTVLSIVILLSMSFFLAPSWAYNSEDDSSIMDLTELDFANFITEHKVALVNFHALWCRYSKKLKPVWKELEGALKTGNYEVVLARVEAYDEKKLAEQYGVEGYPTIKLFIDQTPHDYNGERTKEHILEFVDRKVKNPLKTVSSADEVTKYLEEYEWVGILAGDDKSNQDAVKDAAFNIGDVLFVATTSDAVKQKYGVQDGQFVLVNKISGGSNVNTESLSADSLTKFIAGNKFPSIAKFSKGTAERVFLSEEPSMILLRATGDSGNNAQKAFEDANKKIGDKIFMSVANYEDEIGKLLVENLGVKASALPTVRIVRADKERIRKYALEGDVTSDKIVQLHDDYTNKKAKRSYLSEPVPAENNDLVKTVVLDTFKDMVLDPNSDVLLHIWAPWCGHCRAMMPVYDNVARKTREVPNFIVAKIDASVNDLEAFGLDIVEYPTILFFTKSNKDDPIEFKDERNEYKFNDFIRANAKVNLDRMKGPNPFDKNEL